MLRSLARVSLPVVSKVQAARSLTSSSLTPVTLPALGYAYDALSPVLSAKIMETHHSKHHNAYVTNYNAAIEKYRDLEKKGDIAGMIALQPAIRFNGGGHVNHSIFWTNLAPVGKGGQPSAELSEAIKKRWGSIDALKTDFNAKAVGVQGSGWAWLAYCPTVKGLTVVTCANQDPCSTTGTVPLLGLDVWEHAYYLDYLNVRPTYATKFWDVVNWNNVSERFAKAKA